MKVEEICHSVHMLLSCNTVRSAIKQRNFSLIIGGHDPNSEAAQGVQNEQPLLSVDSILGMLGEWV